MELLDEGSKDAAAWVRRTLLDARGSQDARTVLGEDAQLEIKRNSEPHFEDEGSTLGSLKLEAHEDVSPNSDDAAAAYAMRLENARLLNESLQLQNQDLLQKNAVLKMQLQQSSMMNSWSHMPVDPRSWPVLHSWPQGMYAPIHAANPLCYTSASGNKLESSDRTPQSRGILETVAPEELTTVMMRNIPNNYTREMLFQLLNDKGFKTKYDLVYLPLDFKKKVGLGYAFVNFVDHGQAELFKDVFKGFSGWVAQSEKVCEVTWSDAFQGRELNIARYRNSPIMHEAVPDVCKPVLFGEDGERISFPLPTKRIRAPKEWQME
jgi:hypothetical protein